MINVGGAYLTLNDFEGIIFKKEKINLNDKALEKVDGNYRFLKDFSSHKIIYGINTGFGPMAQYKVKDEDILQLQYNLIRSHASGAGKLLSSHTGKAIMVARLNSLMRGYSGIHTDLVVLLSKLINQNIIPCFFEHGGVGASGDLVQLAHLALVLIGEGEVIFEEEVQPAKAVFEKCGIEPLSIHTREGIAVLNGTSAMTGIGLLNIVHAKKILHWATMLSALTNELMQAYNDHFSFELNAVKYHQGQSRIAEMMRNILNDSKLIRDRSEHLYNPDKIKHDVFEDKVQEYYSLRCVTQVLGPVYDTIEHAEKVVTDELNSVNDNPVIDDVNKNIYHGGNFHGDYVALEMDKLKIAITKLSMLSERQLNYLLNNKLNQKFPPFLNLGVLGLNFGMQGMQFTATSTVAENQTLSFPMYVHSIPNNNDNQDIVSMGAYAASLTKKIIRNTFEVLAIQAMTIMQAIDYLQCNTKLSTASQAVYTDLRKIFPSFVEDKPKYKDLEKVCFFMENNDPISSLIYSDIQEVAH